MAEKKKRTGIWGYVDSAVEAYDKYKDIAKAGASAVKGYLDYKNQKEANEAAERAYNDYTAEKDSAGLEAQAAVDINLTPMAITGLAKNKADVTDFTALAANGGIIGLKMVVILMQVLQLLEKQHLVL